MREAIFRCRKFHAVLVMLAGVLFYMGKDYRFGVAAGVLTVLFGWASWHHRGDANLRVSPVLAIVSGIIAAGACGCVLVLPR